MRGCALALNLNLNLNRMSQSTPTDRQFSHEKLEVYQKAIQFVAWSGDLIKELPKSHAVRNQLERASTSVPLNIAEGNGKYTEADRCRYFDIARGSALECAAALDVVVAKQAGTIDDVRCGREMLLEIVPMLVGMIRANSSTRVK